MQQVKVYSTQVCPYCVQAKSLLKQQNIAFEDIDLSADPATRQRLSEENNGYRTVPMIFIGDTFIGGFQQLAELHQSGKLNDMVNS